MRKNIFIIIPLLLPLVSCGTYKIKEPFSYSDEGIIIEDNLAEVNNEKAHIVLLYGQSNADGCSSSSFLRQTNESKYTEYNTGYENVYINYYNDLGRSFLGYTFDICTLGCGYSQGQYGPEMGIAEMMSAAYPTEKTFIIKRTWGGTALKTQWLNGKCQRGQIYNSAMDFTYKCLDYLKIKGYDLTIDGICWMQGESDCAICNKESYYKNTEAFVSLLRYDLKNYQSNIRFIDAMISDVWDNSPAINAAKVEFEKTSSLNYLIDTTSLTTNLEPEGNPDLAHYDSLSMVKLGQDFGKILITK